MGKFGWDLPPGCTHKMLDDAMGLNEPCDMCGRSIDDCICPECPVCSEYGDKQCYSKHGMIIDAEQLAGMNELAELYFEEQRTGDALYEQWKEDKRLEDEWLQGMKNK